jgi:hypothetical protein
MLYQCVVDLGVSAAICKAMEMLLPLKPAEADRPKTAGAMSADQMRAFAGTYVNGPQTWEIILKGDRLFLRRESDEFALAKTGEHRLSFGSALENDLVFVPGADGQPEHLFDGLYSARRIR